MKGGKYTKTLAKSEEYFVHEISEEMFLQN